LSNGFTGKGKLYVPVHKRKANTATGLLVSVKNRRKGLKITRPVFTAEKKGAHGGKDKPTGNPPSAPNIKPAYRLQ
jgi:hypothetical protein